MMKYHKERMATVNKIIKKLWKAIYVGNDTSSIEIRTNDTSGTASGRRSYNYKLVQIKNGREMDMRGRCSAGQKVNNFLWDNRFIFYFTGIICADILGFSVNYHKTCISWNFLQRLWSSCSWWANYKFRWREHEQFSGCSQYVCNMFIIIMCLCVCV